MRGLVCDLREKQKGCGADQSINFIAGGSRETNWLITLQRPEGLLFIVFVAPDRDSQGYESTFQQMLRSVRISR
jgi:hypothetical protein